MDWDLLALKLVLTPLLVGFASWLSKAWGPTVGGLFVGLPWSSGPISVFLTLERGTRFASQAAVAMIAGLIAVGVFCFAYATVARRRPWHVSLAAGLVAFALADLVLVQVPWSATGAAAATWTTLALGAALLPAHLPMRRAPEHPRWEVPVRMAVATALLLALTAFAGVLGPAWTGLLSPFPVYASVLGVFLHRRSGSGAVVEFQRGVLLGAFSFPAFFLPVALRLGAWGPGATYAVSVALSVGVGAVVFRLSRLVRRRHMAAAVAPKA